jgi:hypothetical protein
MKLRSLIKKFRKKRSDVSDRFSAETNDFIAEEGVVAEETLKILQLFKQPTSRPGTPSTESGDLECVEDEGYEASPNGSVSLMEAAADDLWDDIMNQESDQDQAEDAIHKLLRKEASFDTGAWASFDENNHFKLANEISFDGETPEVYNNELIAETEVQDTDASSSRLGNLDEKENITAEKIDESGSVSTAPVEELSWDSSDSFCEDDEFYSRDDISLLSDDEDTRFSYGFNSNVTTKSHQTSFRTSLKEIFLDALDYVCTPVSNGESSKIFDA